ncbi:MAG: TAT-variant-translocated molybdopterin oxidoreductase [Verrucomicrobiae bacterium]|nr:TAT-variant-translocated molybdopterin oxidoreductase [Verrucomicrobiae bacterium]
MKRVIQHPAPETTGRKYWRSLEELAESPAFQAELEREFPQGAAEFHGDDLSRRNFLRLMGASMALAGVGFAGCRRPEAYITPYRKSPEWAIPGRSLFYTTAMPRRKGAMPLMATTYDGRPTKIEGNPGLPGSRTATDAIAQASILDLYDPDRAKDVMAQGKPSTLEAFWKQLSDLRTQFAANKGAGLAILANVDSSPTRSRLKAELRAQFPAAIWAEYDPILAASSLESAQELLLGQGVTQAPLYDKAKVILSLDCDFLGFFDGTTDSIKKFADGRRVAKPGDGMNRLYAVENRYTLTGGMADHRLRLPASQIPAFTALLAKELEKTGLNLGLNGAADAIAKVSAKDDFKTKWIAELAQDLIRHKGSALVVAGSNQPVAVHVLTAAINSALDSYGTTISTVSAPTREAKSIQDLAAAIEAKSVQTLFVLGGNPVYDAPAELNWASLQKSVPQVIRSSYYRDESSTGAQWFVPTAHYLESWGDGLTPEGAYVCIQPTILPLFAGVSQLQILAALLGQPVAFGPQAVQETFRQISKNNSELAWNEFVHDGVLTGSSAKSLGAKPAIDRARTAISGSFASLGDKSLELVLVPSTSVEDGQFANNGWLQELPDTITKNTWGNAALVSPKTAKELGIESHVNKGIHYGKMVALTVNKRQITVPVLVAPGHADNSISLSLGYGRTQAGRAGNGVGFNAYPIRTSEAPYVMTGVSLKPTGEETDFALTQEHGAMEGRAIVREATSEAWAANPGFAKEQGIDGHQPYIEAVNPYTGQTEKTLPSIYKHPLMTGLNQWGMTIDLNTCVGCNACMVACQSENNIPVVGREQVQHNREMHWIRIDRYFAGPEGTPDENAVENPEMVMQPMACQQCENAPCETVCPVNATVHSEEGLNVMTYNRCIGTRYCANNCPYKVRRFNFFDYNKRPIHRTQVGLGPLKVESERPLYFGPLATRPEDEVELIKMQKNPNVTVRMRGVMEKCTYCVQRLEGAKIEQLARIKGSENHRLPDGVVKTACQQVCPAEAITFGNINDANSAVAKAKNDPRNYQVLAYIGTVPRTSYLARIRNPNPKMPDAISMGLISTPAGHEGEHGHESHDHTPHAADPHSAPAEGATSHGGSGH